MMIAANIISMTILFAVPLLLVAMGGMFSEHSGVINIALEGMMIIGALFACFTLQGLDQSGFGPAHPQLSMFIAILVAGVTGMIFSLLLGFAAINLKAVGWLLDRLMVHAVGLYFGRAGDALKDASLFKANGMHRLAERRLLLMRFFRNVLLRFNILDERATHGDVEHLNPAADAENRHVARDGHRDNQQLENVALWVVLSAGGQRFFAISRRQNITAACKKETVQSIQNRFGGFFILDFRQQHGNPARAEHRLHVVFADKHLAVGDIV